MRRPSLVIAALAILVARAAPPAGAQKPPAPVADRQRALALYERGLHHYQLAEFDAAVAAFKASYRLVPDPELLFNIAQAYRRIGPERCADALEFYRNYRTARPDAAGEVDARVVDMERCVAAQRPAPASPAVGAAPASDPAPPPEAPARWPAIALAAAGAGALAAGVVVRARAGRRADELWLVCGSACPADEIDGVRSRGRIGLGLAIAGGAALVGAGVVWWLRGRAEAPALAVVPAAGGVGLAGWF